MSRRSPGPSLRHAARHPGRAPAWAGGRRVPPTRTLFPPVPARDKLELLETPNLPFALLALVALLALGDVLALHLAPPLARPLYGLTLLGCGLVVVVSLISPERDEEEVALLDLVDTTELPLPPRRVLSLRGRNLTGPLGNSLAPRG